MSYEEEDACAVNTAGCHVRRRIHACHMRRRMHVLLTLLDVM
jgi:hypothetical protein